MEEYEQIETGSRIWSWAIVIVFSASLIAWALIMHALVRDVPRAWDFGQLPSTPGASPYSTKEPPAEPGPVPRQIEPLPEAKARKSD